MTADSTIVRTTIDADDGDKLPVLLKITWQWESIPESIEWTLAVEVGGEEIGIYDLFEAAHTVTKGDGSQDHDAAWDAMDELALQTVHGLAKR